MPELDKQRIEQPVSPRTECGFTFLWYPASERWNGNWGSVLLHNAAPWVRVFPPAFKDGPWTVLTGNQSGDDAAVAEYEGETAEQSAFRDAADRLATLTK